MAAWIMSLVGGALSLIIGLGVLGWGVGEVLLAFVASCVGIVIAPLVTLQAEQNPWLKRQLLRGWLPTWALLSIVYFGILLLISPSLRHLESCAWMALPLILAAGWTLPTVFGPIQDRIVHARQRGVRFWQFSGGRRNVIGAESGVRRGIR